MTLTIPSLPASGASPKGFGSDFQPDLATGTGNYSLALDLPPGEIGFRPELMLGYSSGAGQGPFGQGWALGGLMAVRVSTRRGVPDPAQAGQRTYSLDGGDDLVPMGGGQFRPRTDTRSWQIAFDGTAWTIVTQDGTTYRCGASANARVADPDTGEVMEWHLSDIALVTGQSAHVSYAEHGPARLPEQIDWGPFAVRFDYTPRPDALHSARYGFRLTTAHRCTAIRVLSARAPDGQLRRYDLTYDEARHTGQSRLTGIAMSGDPGKPDKASRAMTFGYDEWTHEQIAVRRITAEGELPPSPAAATAALIDLEGRGLPGILEGQRTGWRFWRNLGRGHFAAPVALGAIPAGLSLADRDSALIDLEGNGTADLFVNKIASHGFFPNRAEGLFDGFVDYGTRPPVSPTDPSVRFIDIDGDGVVDAIRTEPDALVLHTNHGAAGWDDAPLRIPRVFDPDLFPDVDFADRAIQLADMSGDGLADIVRIERSAISYWPYLGHGRWGARVAMYDPPQFPLDFDRARLRLVDIDGDGLTDLVYCDFNRLLVWRNRHGEGWSEAIAADLPPGFFTDMEVTDIFGSGRAALLLGGPDPDGGIQPVLHAVDLSSEVMPNLLTRIESSLGHTTTITYGSSTTDLLRDETGGAGWATFAPFPVPVCRSVENHDRPAGLTHRSNYHYRDGHYCGIEREFCGFGEVEESEVVAGAEVSKRTVSHFHIGTDPALPEKARRAATEEDRLRARALRGSPLAVETYEDAAGQPSRLLHRLANRFTTRVEHDDGERIVIRPILEGSVEDQLDPDGSGARQVWEYSPPDARGNNERITHRTGLLAADGSWRQDHQRNLHQQFATSGPVTRLAARRIDDGAGRLLAAERWRFDGPDFDGLPFGEIARGLVTRHEELVFADGQDDPGPDPATRGFFRLDEPGAPPGWYRCRARHAHDPSGRLRAIRDAFDHELLAQYDGEGIDLVRTTDAVGRVTRIGYDHGAGQPDLVTYPSGLTERRSYDSLGRVIASYRTQADGTEQLVTATHYGECQLAADGAVVRPPAVTTFVGRRPGLTLADLPLDDARTTPDTFVIRRFYGASGLDLGMVVSGTPDADGNDRTRRAGALFHQGNGWLVSQGQPRFDGSHEWVPPDPAEDLAYRVVLDALGRTIVVETPSGRREVEMGTTRSTLRDPNSMAADLGPPLRQDFDGMGRLRRAEEAIAPGEVSSKTYRHDAKGDLIDVADDDGTVLSAFGYDRQSSRTRIAHRDAGERALAYDAMGRLVATVTPTGQRLDYSYDPIGRLAEVRATEADGSPGGTKRFIYDAAARLAAVEENGERTDYRYDAAGRLVEKTRTIGPGQALTFAYGYDFLGNMTALTYPNGHEVRYSYGPSGEITGIADVLDQVTYSPRGLPERIDYANGASTRLAFSEADRLDQLTVATPRGTAFRQRLEYDANGNITACYESGDAVPERRLAYSYDRANRLTGGERADDGGVSALTIAYDRDGNLLENSEHAIGPLVYDVRRKSLLTSAAPGTVRRYDAGGRTVATEHLSALRYDAYDRLRRVERFDGRVVEFAFDYLGGRTRRTTTDGDSVTTVLCMDDLFERGPDGDRVIIRGPAGIAAIIHFSGGASRVEFCHGDHLGSLRCRTDAGGATIGQVSYSSFGLAGGHSNLALYTGKFGDEDIGLIQLGQRFYEPLTGRFLTPDPVLIERPEIAGALPGYLNPFAYAGNNPIRNVDPTGRFPVLAIIIIGAVIGAAIGAAAANERGENVFMGALIGGLVGGLAGWAGMGVLTSALIGAGMGALTASKDNMWTGAAVGFAFGALGGAVGQWLPVIPGESTGALVGNFFIEVAADGLVAGLAAGTSAHLNGEHFGKAFESGFISGALFSSVRVAVFGVRYSPTTARADVADGAGKEFARQSELDTRGPWSAKSNDMGMPKLDSVTVRRGGLLTLTGRSHAIAPDTVTLSSDGVTQVSKGDYSTLAHELRHVTQQRVAGWGWFEYAVVWLASDFSLHYSKDSSNTTPEPYY